MVSFPFYPFHPCLLNIPSTYPFYLSLLVSCWGHENMIGYSKAPRKSRKLAPGKEQKDPKPMLLVLVIVLGHEEPLSERNEPRLGEIASNSLNNFVGFPFHSNQHGVPPTEFKKEIHLYIQYVPVFAFTCIVSKSNRRVELERR